jgi:hypothetical protein
MCTSADLDIVTDALNDRLDNCRGFMLHIVEIERKLIQSLQKSQEEFISKYAMKDLGDNFQKILTEIYERKNVKALSGK